MAVTFTPVDIANTKFVVPTGSESKIYEVQDRPSIDDVSSGAVDGSGIFDVLMRALKSQLQQEFEEHRITGSEYTRAYIELTQSALSASMQFLTARDASFWASQGAQVQTITSLVQLETARAGYASAAYNFETLQPLQARNAEAQAEAAEYNVATTLPIQTTTLEHQRDTAEYNLDNMLPQQLLLVTAQTEVAENQATMVVEQTQVQRAHTMDTRLDGITSVAGLLGKQKDLYTQQITSYQHDAHTKMAKVFADSWITQKTVDEAVTAPTAFTNANINDVFDVLRDDMGLAPSA